jgi:uncharacterized membrane protein YbhN (UPF0104 family)
LYLVSSIFSRENLCNLVVIKMKNKKTLKFLLLPVTLLLLILIIHNIELSNLYSTIVRANLGCLILAVALQASSILVRNLKWQILVNGIKKAPFFSLLVMLLAGSFMDTATLGPQVGGCPLKAYFLSKKIKVNKATCLSTVLVESLPKHSRSCPTTRRIDSFFTYFPLALGIFRSST